MPSASPIRVSVMPAQIEQPIPVGVVAGHSRDLQVQDDADVAESDVGGQASAARAAFRRGARDPHRPPAPGRAPTRGPGPGQQGHIGAASTRDCARPARWSTVEYRRRRGGADAQDDPTFASLMMDVLLWELYVCGPCDYSREQVEGFVALDLGERGPHPGRRPR